VDLDIGTRLRSERTKAGIGVRELARKVGLSASLISQIERGSARPSVASLAQIADGLGISLGDLFNDNGSAPSPSPDSANPVQRAEERDVVQMEFGVRWERLAEDTERDLDFFELVYPVGAESCPEDALIRHGGYEYGYVKSGKLGVRVGFKSYELGPGDSISFASMTPHRLWNAGDEEARMIWVHLGNRGD
jgi:transcriptional regulator with XRE-family HTH domain